MKPLLALLFAAPLLSCGGQATAPLSLTFPMGPKEVRLALGQQFPDVLAPDDAIWPATEPAMTVDVKAVEAAPFSLPSAPAFAGKTLELDGASVSVDTAGSPFDSVELFVGPAGATSVTDAQVVDLGHASVARSKGSATALTWSANGPGLLAAALDGKLDGQNGKRSATFLLEGRAPVGLSPGQALPASTPAEKVRVDIPIRYLP